MKITLNIKGENMKKTKSIILQNEIDPKIGLVLIKDYNSYNSIKFYLQKMKKNLILNM